MPLYLIRWPNMSASIVRASDRDELYYMLDEVADPGCAEISDYDGPLWLEMQVPIDFELPEKGPVAVDSPEIVFRGVDKLQETFNKTGVPIEITQADDGCDTQKEMFDAVTKRAFPRLVTVV